MNDFKARKYSPSQSELLMARKDTYVDGTDEVPPAADATKSHSFDELVEAVSIGWFNTFDKVTVNTGTLNFLVAEYTRLRETISKIEETLGY